MLIRRYLFIEGPYRGTAKISPQGSDRILVEVTVDGIVEEEIKAYLTGKEGELSFYVGVCKKEGNKMRLAAEFREKQLQEKHVNLEECGCIVLAALKDGKENKEGKEYREEEVPCQEKSGPVQQKIVFVSDITDNPVQTKGKIKKLPSFEESFGCGYGLRWQTYSFDNMPPVNELISVVLLNQGAIECINQYGGFYLGRREEDIQVIGIPACIGKDPMPCLNIFRTLSYIKEKNEKFGCYMIGLNQKLGVLFPAIFE